LPRKDVPKGTRDVEVGLRVKEGSEAFQIGVTVYAPDGTVAVASVWLREDQWTAIHYPRDFRGSPGGALAPGTYTVVWDDVVSGRVACDGFVVSP
jgi:hypothetical protein